MEEDELEVHVARSEPGDEWFNTLAPLAGPCFIFIQIVNLKSSRAYANEPYKLSGINTGTIVSGTTSGEGILRHDFLPDDHYHLECAGTIEIVEVYYRDEVDIDGEEPWTLRMRDEDRVVVEDDSDDDGLNTV